MAIWRIKYSSVCKKVIFNHGKPHQMEHLEHFGESKSTFCEYDVDWYSRISIMKYGNDRFLQSWWIFHSDSSLPIQVCHPVHWIARISMPLIHFNKSMKNSSIGFYLFFRFRGFQSKILCRRFIWLFRWFIRKLYKNVNYVN